MGRLQTVTRDGVQVDQRLYDGAGRVVQSGPVGLRQGYADKLNEDLPPDEQTALEIRRQRYDANGQLLFECAFETDGSTPRYDIAYTGYGRDGTVLGYDATGNVKAYEYTNYTGDNDINTAHVTLGRYEGYVELSTTTSSSKFDTGTSRNQYDANGNLIGVDDTTEDTLDKNVVTDASGHVLRVYQAGNALWTHIVNGEIMGTYGVGPNEMDPRTKKNKANFQQVADFDLGYRSISGSYPAPGGVGSYTVRTGDTLKGIAQNAFGDASLWWKVAQANGMQGDSDLRVGQTITLPSVVAGTSNNAGTFKPYNPADVVGDTSPNLPMPKNSGGCGGVGMIIMIVVAVIVTIYTAGAAASLLSTVAAEAGAAAGGGLAGALAATEAVAGSVIGVAAGAVGAAAGSIVSQGVGMAIGAQKDFSWKQVAQSAIGGAVSAGLATPGGAQTTLTGSGLQNTFVRAAMSNALSQGVGMVVGLQKSFNWAGVAGAAIGAGVGQSVSANVGADMNGALGNQFAERVVTGTVAGFAGGVTVALMRGGRVSAQQVAADAFGNALGESIREEMLSNGRSRTSDGTRYVDGDVGRSELRISSAPLPSFPVLPAVGGADGSEEYVRPAVDRSRDVLLASGPGYAGLGRTPQQRVQDELAAIKQLTTDLHGLARAYEADSVGAGSRVDINIVDGSQAAANLQARVDAAQHQFYQEAPFSDSIDGDVRARAQQWRDSNASNGSREPEMSGSSADASELTFDRPAWVPAMQPGLVTGSELGDQALGGLIGATDTGYKAAAGTVHLAGNALVTIGDVVSGGAYHDSPIVQQAEVELGAVFNGIGTAIASPRETMGHVYEGMANDYARAQELRARGDELGAARVNGGLASSVAATALGGVQTVRGVARLGAAGLRGAGARDWNIVAQDINATGLGRSQRGAVGVGLEPIQPGGAGKIGNVEGLAETAEKAAAAQQLAAALRYRALGWNHEQGKFSVIETMAISRAEKTFGKTFQPSSIEGVDIIDPSGWGNVYLKGPFLNRDLQPLTDAQQMKAVSNVAKHIQQNTAVDTHILDTTGMSKATEEALKEAVRNANQRIIFMRGD